MIYSFADFVLDGGRRELRRGDELISVEPQVFDVLQFLIDNRERVVSSDDLIESVWRGRIVSETTIATRMNAVRRAIGDSGERQQFVRTIARKGYRFIGKVEEHAVAPNDHNTARAHMAVSEIATPKPESTQAPAMPDKPSIAVLPFSNLSGDREQNYFADGISEDLIIALSQFRWLFVIARNSSFMFKGKALDEKQIAKELGVRYLLEGSVRKAGGRVRITGQLVEAANGTHLWADRFDGSIEDIFDLQDKVTASVIGAIGPKLEQAEIDRAKRKPTESLDAYDYYLRGMASLHRGDNESTDEALRMLYRAIKLDPDFVSAYGMAAWCYDLRKWNGWTVDADKETAEAERLARQAVALGKDDAVALCTGGFALAHAVGDLEVGAACIDRALMLNPNLAAAWYFGGWVSSFLGEPDTAIERIARAMRLEPIALFPFPAQSAVAWAHFVAGRYQDSYFYGQKALREQPDFQPSLRIFAAACAMAGHLEEARATIARVLELGPSFRISNIKEVTRFRHPEDLARYEDALRKAGMPE